MKNLLQLEIARMGLETMSDNVNENADWMSVQQTLKGVYDKCDRTKEKYYILLETTFIYVRKQQPYL